MDRMRVLAVDDRVSVLDLVASILEDGFDVIRVGDGRTAIGRLATTAFDLVLTDVRLPGASGFEVLQAARAVVPAPAVVIMTAYANVPDAVSAIRLGAVDYVAKPFSADELLAIVTRAAEEGASRGARAADPDADATGAGSRTFREAVAAARDRASRAYLARLLRVHGGNVTHAARDAGLTRESLHRLLRQLGVRG